MYHIYRKIKSTRAHNRAMIRNMTGQLIMHDKIQTTFPKAKAIQRTAEKLVTLAKKDNIRNRHFVQGFLFDADAHRKLFTEFAERFKDRQGGYTRITRDGFRKGDRAPMAIIEYLDREKIPKFTLADVAKISEKERAEKKAKIKAEKTKNKSVPTTTS